MEKEIHSLQEFQVTLSGEILERLIHIARNSPSETIPVISYFTDSGFERMPDGSHMGGTGPIFDFGLAPAKELNPEKYIFFEVGAEMVGVSRRTLGRMAGTALEIQERRFGRNRDSIARIIWPAQEEGVSEQDGAGQPDNHPEKS